MELVVMQQWRLKSIDQLVWSEDWDLGQELY